jgi:hypothetical protein
MCGTIEVGYTRAAGVGGLGIFHKYIIFTDCDGNQYYARGGPGNFGPGAAGGGYDPFSLSPFGSIWTESGPYVPGTPDWDPAREPGGSGVLHPRETIIEGGPGRDLTSEWERITSEMQDINARDIPYDPRSTNSNATVDEALRRVGLPSPAMDGPRDFWAPGSDVDLPGEGDPNFIPETYIPPPEPPSFIRDLLDWARHRAYEGARGLPGTAEAEGWGGIDPTGVNGGFNGAARTRRAPRDPLALDLDGDGIETIGVGANPVLFDHNDDGIRTGTGWVLPDDAWLALDRNGNGTIDSGRELFGVDTVLSGTPGVDAVYASTGFEALRTLDANADNVFNNQDAAFTQVRLWRDLNQDGISQANELTTLAAQGIASIALTASNTTINLGNGNTVSGTATVTRSNGTTTHVDAVSVTTDITAGNLNLANNPFYRQFTTPVALTTTARALPEMGGSGWVRDLREAMSLGTAQGWVFAQSVAGVAAGNIYSDRRAKPSRPCFIALMKLGALP